MGGALEQGEDQAQRTETTTTRRSLPDAHGHHLMAGAVTPVEARANRANVPSACDRSRRCRSRCGTFTLDSMNDAEARARAIRILVRSLYRELVAQGFDDKHILAVATELVGKVTDKLAEEREPRVEERLPRRA